MLKMCSSHLPAVELPLHLLPQIAWIHPSNTALCLMCLHMHVSMLCKYAINYALSIATNIIHMNR